MLKITKAPLFEAIPNPLPRNPRLKKSKEVMVRSVGKDSVIIGSIWEQDTENYEEAEANANLFVEALHVANETGLTPRDLMAQKEELLKALGRLAYSTEYLDASDRYDIAHSAILKVK